LIEQFEFNLNIQRTCLDYIHIHLFRSYALDEYFKSKQKKWIGYLHKEVVKLEKKLSNENIQATIHNTRPVHQCPNLKDSRIHISKCELKW
jgi:hypothetical protein